MSMEIKIGEIYKHSSVGYITAKASKGCGGCVLKNPIDYCKQAEQGYCANIDRKDNTSVIFVKVTTVGSNSPNELKVGEEFNHPEVGTVIAKEQEGCSKCIFNNTRYDCSTVGSCSANLRSDGKSVVFVEKPKIEKPSTERAIGSIFKDPEFGDLIVCVHTDCDDCIFTNRGTCGTEDCNEGNCQSYRSDGISVMFKKYTPPSTTLVEKGIKTHKDLENLITVNNGSNFPWCEPVPAKPANWDRLSDSIVVERETGIMWIHEPSSLETDPRTILLSE